VLLVAGGAGMVKEFFNILDDHKQKTKEYYESLTQQELDHLEKVEEELIYEHNKNIEFLAEERAKNLEFLAGSKLLNDIISNRPIENGIEAALKRYLESAAISRSLGGIPIGENLLNGSQNSLASSED
jgi:rubrerythrin